MSRLHICICLACLFAIGIFNGAEIKAETSIRSKRAEQIGALIWKGAFPSALDSCQKLISEEQANPLGYFLASVAYYSIYSQYRNASYSDSVAINIDTAIKLIEKGDAGETNNAERYLLLGSTFGVKSLYSSVQGDWPQAFVDGNRMQSNLQKALQIDSAYTGALSGIGIYHYWKSAKTILPFGGDKRQQGITEILQGIRSGGVMSVAARKSLLAIYNNEKRYKDEIAVADSLEADSLLDPNSRLHRVKALIELGQYAKADNDIEIVQTFWRNSPYFDTCGAHEAIYLKARILIASGDTALVRTYLQQVLSSENNCRSNAYFRKTLSFVRGLK